MPFMDACWITSAQSMNKIKGDFSEEKKKGIYKMATSEVAVSAATAAAQAQWGEPEK